jgi:surface protein
MKKLLLLSLTVLLFSCGDNDGDNNEPCGNQPNLETNAVNQVNYDATTNAYTANLSGNIDNIPTGPNCEVLSITSQGFVYDTTIQPTTNDNVIEADGQQVSGQISGLPNETTYYVRTYITNPLGTFYGNQISFETGNEICNTVYLADNGITIKACEQANIGDIGMVNGIEYTVVDNDMFLEMMAQYGVSDNTQICTTRVNDMTGMSTSIIQGSGNSTSSWNEPIGHWDTSNVVYMSYMFRDLINFNQDISFWDVSNVIEMRGMFEYAIQFDGDISNWDVSNVTNMAYMFYSYESPYNSVFNQDISNWDVSEVTDMSFMFTNCASFNQDLSSWDVSNVNDYNAFSLNADSWTLPQPNFN